MNTSLLSKHEHTWLTALCHHPLTLDKKGFNSTVLERCVNYADDCLNHFKLRFESESQTDTDNKKSSETTSQPQSNQIIHSLICNIVDDASGGIKFPELFTKLLSICCEKNISINPKETEQICRSSNYLKVLNYTYNYLNSPKMFIYTNQEQKD